MKSLAKSVLISLGLTASPSRADAVIHKNIRIWNNNINNIKWRNGRHYENRLVSEYSRLLLKGISKTFQIEAKEQKVGFLSMLLGALGAVTSQGRGIRTRCLWI